MSTREASCSFHFVNSAKGLQIHIQTTGKGMANGILMVDFLSASQNYRRLHGGGVKQPLARAAGIKPGIRPSVVDVTAGLGKDAFALACLGCRVIMVERSPVLAALLEDGLERASRDTRINEIMGDRLSLIQGEGCSILGQMKTRPDTIYLDPMYPHRPKSALNKQEMRIIRAIVGDDLDADKLLLTSLRYAGKRVVVKRPKGAPNINNQVPSHIINMKNSRYDIYMIRG